MITLSPKTRTRIAVLGVAPLLALSGGVAVDTATAEPAAAEPAGLAACLSKKPYVTITDTGSRIVARADMRRCLGVGQKGFRVPVHVQIEKLVGIPGQRRWQNWSAWGGRHSWGPTDATASIPREPGRFRARARVGRKGGFSQTGAIDVRARDGGWGKGSGGRW